jgi:hypothetical protein
LLHLILALLCGREGYQESDCLTTPATQKLVFQWFASWNFLIEIAGVGFLLYITVVFSNSLGAKYEN